LKSKSLDSEWMFEKGLLFPLVSGTDIRRYAPLPQRQFVLFPYKVQDAVELISMEELSSVYPKTAAYLLANRQRLADREKGRLDDAHWQGYVYLKNMKRQSHVKLTVPRLVNRLFASLDNAGTHFLDNVDVGGITIKPEYRATQLHYVVGIINSRLMGWYFPLISAPFRGGYMSANKQFLSQLPIYLIDFSKPAEKAKHDKMVSLVESMLKLHKEKVGARLGQEKAVLQQQIEATDAQIDRLVYDLYGLMEDEIKIVESAT